MNESNSTPRVAIIGAGHSVPRKSGIIPLLLANGAFSMNLPFFRDTRREREKPEYVLSNIDRERIRLAEEKREKKAAKRAAKKVQNIS